MPLTCADVKPGYVPNESAPRAKPVIDAYVIGLTPMSPEMTDVGTFVMPALERITKFAAVPKSTVVAVVVAVASTTAHRTQLNPFIDLITEITVRQVGERKKIDVRLCLARILQLLGYTGHTTASYHYTGCTTSPFTAKDIDYTARIHSFCISDPLWALQPLNPWKS